MSFYAKCCNFRYDKRPTGKKIGTNSCDACPREWHGYWFTEPEKQKYFSKEYNWIKQIDSSIEVDEFIKRIDQEFYEFTSIDQTDFQYLCLIDWGLEIWIRYKNKRWRQKFESKMHNVDKYHHYYYMCDQPNKKKRKRK
jgi:hypothetical protein